MNLAEIGQHYHVTVSVPHVMLTPAFSHALHLEPKCQRWTPLLFLQDAAGNICPISLGSGDATVLEPGVLALLGAGIGTLTALRPRRRRAAGAH